MNENPYKQLAEKLDALPNGFPPTEDGAELDLLAKLYTPEEAALAARLRLTLETPEQIASRLEKDSISKTDVQTLKNRLKSMAKKGLIAAGRTEKGLGYGLMPFVVGVYEMQIGRVDEELARLFENYYQQAFSQMLTIEPTFHRVVPIGESIKTDMEVHPFESASEIVNSAQAWGVMECICRVQKSLIDDPCDHPVDVCMIMSQRPGAFDNVSVIRSQTREEALDTLRKAAKAGLVHSVSNRREDTSYICNCCTCSCGILRGMSELGIANVIAHSAFVNQVDVSLCTACTDCIESCQFEALELLNSHIVVSDTRCVGCGACVTACPENALMLIRRPPEDILSIPATDSDWRMLRAEARGQDIGKVL